MSTSSFTSDKPAAKTTAETNKGPRQHSLRAPSRTKARFGPMAAPACEAWSATNRGVVRYSLAARPPATALKSRSDLVRSSCDSHNSHPVELLAQNTNRPKHPGLDCAFRNAKRLRDLAIRSLFHQRHRHHQPQLYRKLDQGELDILT